MASFGRGRKRTFMKAVPVTIDNWKYLERGATNANIYDPAASYLGYPPIPPYYLPMPPPQFGFYPPPSCYPPYMFNPPPLCCPCPLSQMCCPSPGKFNVQSLPQAKSNNHARHGFSLGSNADQQRSFNNCNFYVSEPPIKNEPMPQSHSQGSFLLSPRSSTTLNATEPEPEPKRVTPGDDKIVEPPVGYPGSKRVPWGNDAEPIVPGLGPLRNKEKPNNNKTKPHNLSPSPNQKSNNKKSKSSQGSKKKLEK